MRVFRIQSAEDAEKRAEKIAKAQEARLLQPAVDSEKKIAETKLKYAELERTREETREKRLNNMGKEPDLQERMAKMKLEGYEFTAIQEPDGTLRYEVRKAVPASRPVIEVEALPVERRAIDPPAPKS